MFENCIYFAQGLLAVISFYFVLKYPALIKRNILWSYIAMCWILIIKELGLDGSYRVLTLESGFEHLLLDAISQIGFVYGMILLFVILPVLGGISTYEPLPSDEKVKTEPLVKSHKESRDYFNN